mgnify:FL=1|tara:strand:- start:372 stop:587 length:216 start_codon:yes stop_codon:yes gene_type:complete
MTAKEKAKELLKRFMSIEDSKSEFIKGSVLLTSTEAKQCALICVDEMLAFDLRFFDIEFLKEVKQEIEKLK